MRVAVKMLFQKYEKICLDTYRKGYFNLRAHSSKLAHILI